MKNKSIIIISVIIILFLLLYSYMRQQIKSAEDLLEKEPRPIHVDIHEPRIKTVPAKEAKPTEQTFIPHIEVDDGLDATDDELEAVVGD